MTDNRGVVYLGPGKVEIQSIADPKFVAPDGRRIEHGVILKVITTNICGSDQHMVRGRTTAPAGLVLGHEITGEVIEKGADVEMLEVGDIVSVPFNVACGRCRTCKSQDTGVCLTVNPSRAGGAYGYVDMGGWIGGQARYVMVPYADFNLLKFPDRDRAMERIRDLTMLSDILPTGFHGAIKAGVGVGSVVYVAGAGPVGLAAAASARILGAAVVMIGDFNKERLQHASNVGFEAVDLSQSDRLGDLIAEITRAAGSIGIPGLYVTEDPGAVDKAAKEGSLSLRFGLEWAKAQSFHTGQTPVLQYNRQLMMAIMGGCPSPILSMRRSFLSRMRRRAMRHSIMAPRRNSFSIPTGSWRPGSKSADRGKPEGSLAVVEITIAKLALCKRRVLSSIRAERLASPAQEKEP